MPQNYLKIARFAEFPQLLHGFGTRLSEEHKNIADRAGKVYHWISIKQIHSDKVHVLTNPPSNQPVGDALLTDRKGMLLTVRTADCLPVLFFDPEHNVVAAAHCGWRGTGVGLVFKVITAMKKNFGTAVSSLIAAMGPCIEADCYEVGEEVVAGFQESELPSDCFFSRPDHPGKYSFDLKRANKIQLLDAGIKRDNIFSVDKCTYCDATLFSYRRDREQAGRLINFIGLSF